MNDMNDTAGSSDEPSLGALLRDEAFRAILKRYSQQCLSWEEFLSHPMPAGMSPVRTWDLLWQMSRPLGIELPIPDLNDNEYWYRRTEELSDIVAVVTRACSPDSRLDRIMSSAGGQHFLINVRIEEGIAASRLDGLAMSEKDADILLRLDRAPRNPTERLVTNTFGAVDILPELIDEPFSGELFRHLRDLMLEGVDTASLRTAYAPLGTGLFEWPDEMVEQYADRQMDYFAAYANHETGDEHDHEVLRGLILTDSFRFYRPLKEVSSQVGRLVAHLYGLKHDLPVLGLLPASRVKLDWDEGRIRPPLVSFDRPTFEDLRRRSPGDLTSMQTLAAQLMLIALRDVERYVDEWEVRDSQLRQTLKKDRLLNERQRRILGKALREPDAEFTIRYHKNNHGIAYPTARRDFLELAEKDYLVLHQRGKAFVFTPSPHLAEMFAAGDGQASAADADSSDRQPGPIA